jgi:hypothetical protein
MWSPGFGWHGILKTLFSPCNIMFFLLHDLMITLNFTALTSERDWANDVCMNEKIDWWESTWWWVWPEMEQITSLVLSSWFKVTYVTCDFSDYVYTSTTIHTHTHTHTHTYSMTINLS